MTSSVTIFGEEEPAMTQSGLFRMKNISKQCTGHEREEN